MDNKPKNKNTIFPGKVVDRFEQKIDGLIMDTDIQSAKLDAIITRGRSAIQWELIRDVLMIVLLVGIAGLLIWRAMVTDARLVTCTRDGEAQVTLDVPNKQ